MDYKDVLEESLDPGEAATPPPADLREAEEPPRAQIIIDLMEALRASLAASDRKGRP